MPDDCLYDGFLLQKSAIRSIRWNPSDKYGNFHLLHGQIVLMLKITIIGMLRASGVKKRRLLPDNIGKKVI